MPRSDIGILPLLLALPFMYAPKVLEGDTQPWVLAGALCALMGFRAREFLRRDALPVAILAMAAIAACWVRTGATPEAIRAAYVLGTFATLYVVAKRGGHDYLATGVRLTLTVWFLVGTYQYVSLLFNLPVTFIGRFVEGRSGVPSLTAEASYFGSLSVLMSMYLLHLRRKSDAPFHVMAVLSVVMSGSLLAAMLLVFPFLYLGTRWKLTALAAGALLFTVDASINDAGITARIAGVSSFEEGALSILLDPSLNLRFGHAYFTLWENLWRELVLMNPVSFMAEYNTFADATGLLIPTESNFVLPIAGELIYQGGLAGLAICIALTREAAGGGSSRGEQLLRIGFVGACLLNPISIANPLFVFYVTQPKCPPR